MNCLKRAAFAIFAAGMTAQVFAASDSPSTDDGGLVIAPSVKIQAQVPLDAKKVAEFCSVLRSAGSTERERAVALAALTKDKAKSSEYLINNLAPKTAPEADTRMGALKGIEVVKPIDQKSSAALGLAAAGDPVAEVRKTATALVKSRGDDYATATMMRTLLSQYDEEGNTRDRILAANAAEALRDLHDKRVYESLLYYVTMELRLANVQAGNLQTRQIDTFAVNSGANVNVLVQLALPIQFPELTMQKVKTTVKCPALNALAAISGEDFGNDPDKWEKFVRKMK